MIQRFDNPLQTSNQDFQEMVFMIQDYLIDESLFLPDEISKVETNLSMNNENQIARQRFMFFRNEICLAIEQNVHGGFGEDDYYRPQNLLKPQHILLIAHAPLMRKKEYLNGKSGLFQVQRFRRLGILSSQRIDNSFLYLELPDNLDLLLKNSGRSDSYTQVLVDILKFHLDSMQRLSSAKSLREIDSANWITGIEEFKVEALKTYQTFYPQDTELHNVEPWSDGYEGINMKDGATVTVFDNKSDGFGSSVNRRCPIPNRGHKFLFHRSGNLDITRMFSSSMVTPDQFNTNEEMSRMTHHLMRYLQLLQKDSFKTANNIEFILGAEYV